MIIWYGLFINYFVRKTYKQYKLNKPEIKLLLLIETFSNDNGLTDYTALYRNKTFKHICNSTYWFEFHINKLIEYGFIERNPQKRLRLLLTRKANLYIQLHDEMFDSYIINQIPAILEDKKKPLSQSSYNFYTAV